MATLTPTEHKAVPEMNHDPDDKIALLAERDELQAKLANAELGRKNDYEAWQRAERLREQAEAKLDGSERACSAFRVLLEPMRRQIIHGGKWTKELDEALACDAGRDYVPRAEVDAICAVAQKVVDEWGRRTMETPMAFAEAISGLTQILAARDARKESAG